MRERIDAPEQLALGTTGNVDDGSLRDDRGHAEHARCDRRVGRSAQLLLGRRIVRAREQLGRWQARFVERTRDQRFRLDAAATTPRGAIEASITSRVGETVATRSARSGLNGCDGGALNGTPRCFAVRTVSLKMYARFSGISAGPSVPECFSIAAKSTGMGRTSRSWRFASAWICVQPKYA